MGSPGGALRWPAARRRQLVVPQPLARAGHWLATHQAAAAGLIFAAFVLVYLWPALVGGEILSPRATLFQFPPWASSAPPGWESTANFILGDVPMAHYPFHVLARDFIHEGTFPAWSPHAYGGVPFFANPQTLVLSPFALPLWVFSLDYGIAVSAALKLWVAAFGTYLLVRELRLGFWPGILAGISFSLSAFGVLWLTHETLLAVAVMLPWNLWLIERTLRTGNRWPALGLVLSVAMVATGGHPGTQVHVLTATAIYAVLRAATMPGLVRDDRLRRLGLIGGATLLGLLLTAVLLVPFLKAAAGTIGVRARLGENDTIPGSQLPLGTIRTALFPDWWGRPSRMSMLGPANYNERTFYAGGVATILAVFALISRGAWRRKAPFAVLGTIGLAVPLHAPGLFWLSTHLPLLRQVQFQRIMLLYVFAIAILGAFGLQRLLEAPAARRRSFAVLAAAVGIGVLALLTAGVSSEELSRALANVTHLRHAVGDRSLEFSPYAGELAATSVGFWLLVVIAAGLALAALWRWPRRSGTIAVLLVAIAAADVLVFAHDYQPMAPAAAITPPRTPAIDYLVRHADEGRLVGLQGALLNDWPAIYGLRDVRGYEPPQPSLRWFHLWKQLVYKEQLDWSQALLFLPTPSGLNALSVLGARYVVALPAAELSTLPRLRNVYEGPDASIALNPDALPRAMVAPTVQVTKGESETIATIGEADFRARETAIVERGEPGAAALVDSSGAGGTAVVSEETSTTVTLRATLRRPGLVVLSDTLAPGWSVEVDGRQASPVRVDDVLRGVVAGPGTHEIVWRYRVPGLRVGFAISLLALATLIGAAILTRRRPAPPAAPASR